MYRSSFIAGTIVILIMLPGRADDEIKRFPDRQHIQQLIQQLGNPSFRVREKAAQELVKTPVAMPFLQTALQSKDQEIAVRASHIIEAITKEKRRESLKKLPALAKNGRMDAFVQLFVDSMIGEVEPTRWKIAASFAHRMSELEPSPFVGLHESIVDRLPYNDFERFLQTHQHVQVQNAENYILKPHLELCWLSVKHVRIEKNRLMSKIVVCSEKWKISTNLPVRATNSVVFVNDNIELNEAWASIIVSDGDVRISGRIFNCLIIARGNVNLGDLIQDTVVVSGREIQCAGKIVRSKLRENEKRPLGFIQFFTLAEAGLEIDTTKNGTIRLAKVLPQSAFVEAGLKAGDEVLAINGVRVESPER